VSKSPKFTLSNPSLLTSLAKHDGIIHVITETPNGQSKQIWRIRAEKSTAGWRFLAILASLPGQSRRMERDLGS
jgi:hypothetical protein